MKGGFLFVVGPSGAGKDALIGFARERLAGDDRFVFPRRVVTRMSSAAEEHDTLSEEDFDAAEKSGAFALSWRAHGLGYGIPIGVVDDVRNGKIVVCNISRRVVPFSRIHFDNVTVVEITAPLELLVARLAGRARPEDGDIEARIARSREVWTEVDHSISNDADLETGGLALLAALTRHAERCDTHQDMAERLVPRFTQEAR